MKSTTFSSHDYFGGLKAYISLKHKRPPCHHMVEARTTSSHRHYCSWLWPWRFFTTCCYSSSNSHQIIYYLIFLHLHLTRAKSKKYIASATLNPSLNTTCWTPPVFGQGNYLLRIEHPYHLLWSHREMNIWHIGTY